MGEVRLVLILIFVRSFEDDLVALLLEVIIGYVYDLMVFVVGKVFVVKVVISLMSMFVGWGVVLLFIF